MDSKYVTDVAKALRKRGVSIDQGLKESELARIEDAYAFRFPPDLRAFLMELLPTSKEFVPWRGGSEEEIRRRLEWPRKGVEFDVENNVFWHEGWGIRPGNTAEAIAVAREQLSRMPLLIPIFSHRYMPSEPIAEGNPVFSVWQTDVIVYGNDLADYLHREFGVSRPDWSRSVPRQIEFWSPLTIY